MENYIRGLESIGESHESFGSLLVPIILNKLPGNIRENMVRAHGGDHWNLPSLRQAIQDEITIKEAGQSVNGDDIEPNFTPTSAFFTGTNRNYANQKGKRDITKKPCIFCQGVYVPLACKNVMEIEDRKRIVKEKQACFNCLGNHRVADCKSDKTCKNCNKRHHTSICSKNETHLHTKSKLIKDNSTSKPDTDATVASMHSSTSSVRSQVLLKTAIAPITYGKTQFTSANILFDEGAPRSFITQEMADLLNLRPHKKEAITISGFGESNKKVRNLQIASIYLKEDNNSNFDFTEANKRYNHKVTLIEHFEKRWRMEYLTGLREFHRVAGDQSAHVKVGSVVQIMDNSPRMMWKLAIIEDVITGNDGVVRAVKLRKRRYIRAMNAGRNQEDRLKKFNNVFVKNIADASEEELRKLFEPYGKITSLKIMTDEDGESRGFCFVCYQNPEDAQTAVQELNGVPFRDQTLFVERAHEKTERQADLEEISKKLKVFVNNLDHNIDDERLRDEFSPFGTITHAKVMKEAGRSKGYGFVCFGTPDAASKAVDQMEGRIVEGKRLHVLLHIASIKLQGLGSEMLQSDELRNITSTLTEEENDLHSLTEVPQTRESPKMETQQRQPTLARGFLNLPQSKVRAANHALPDTRHQWHASIRNGMHDCQTTRQFITVQPPLRPRSETDIGPLYPPLVNQVSGFSVAPMSYQNQTRTGPVSLKLLQESIRSDRNFMVPQMSENLRWQTELRQPTPTSGFLNMQQSQVRAGDLAGPEARQQWHENNRTGMNARPLTGQFETVQPPLRPRSEPVKGQMYPHAVVLNQVRGYSVTPMANPNLSTTNPVAPKFLQEDRPGDMNAMVPQMKEHIRGQTKLPQPTPASGFLNVPQSQLESHIPAAAEARQLCHDNIRKDNFQIKGQFATQQPFRMTESEPDRRQIYPPVMNQKSGYSVTPNQNYFSGDFHEEVGFGPDNTRSPYSGDNIISTFKDIISELSLRPGNIEETTNVIVEMLQNCSEEQVLTKIIATLFEKSISEPGFQYTGALLVKVLANKISKIPAFSNFRNCFFTRCKEEFSRRETLISSPDTVPRLCRFTIFIVELFSVLENSTGSGVQKVPVLRFATRDLLLVLLKHSTNETVTCAIEVLKKAGALIEETAHLNRPEEGNFSEVFSRLSQLELHDRLNHKLIITWIMLFIL
ncbi:PABPC [Mytilus coruscus]|uniref:PABPC n=1 Tax=Mytilus coruscus TaxID=42192 RepID=A0A6J8BMH7_MYTCO|nr:PABPC [Mytilus coruscus]